MCVLKKIVSWKQQNPKLSLFACLGSQNNDDGRATVIKLSFLNSLREVFKKWLVRGEVIWSRSKWETHTLTPTILTTDNRLGVHSTGCTPISWLLIWQRCTLTTPSHKRGIPEKSTFISHRVGFAVKSMWQWNENHCRTYCNWKISQNDEARWE